MIEEILSIDVKLIDIATGEVKEAARERMVLAAARGAARSMTDAPVESEAIVVALRRLSDELAGSIAAGVPDSIRYVRAAVVDFDESGDGARRRELGKVVAAEVATVLRRDHGIILVERGRLRSIMDEHALAMAGVVDPSTAVELGALLGADLLILGDVSEMGDRYRVNVRAVGTQDAGVVGSAQGSLPAAGLVALSADAVVLRSRSGAVFRSVLIPGWGQFYNRQATKGGILLGLEGAVLGAALGFHLVGQSHEAEYNASTDSATAMRTRELAESRYRARNMLLIGAGGLWLVNVVDAWAFGRPASADWSGTGLVLAPSLQGPGLALSGVW